MSVPNCSRTGSSAPSIAVFETRIDQEIEAGNWDQVIASLIDCQNPYDEIPDTHIAEVLDYARRSPLPKATTLYQSLLDNIPVGNLSGLAAGHLFYTNSLNQKFGESSTVESAMQLERINLFLNSSHALYAERSDLLNLKGALEIEGEAIPKRLNQLLGQ